MKRLLALALLVAACGSSPSAAPTTTAAAAPAAPTTARGAAEPAPEETPSAEDASRVIALRNANNARDLGGLRGRKPIPKDRVVRTADLSRVDEADRTTLAQHGVKLDLDLRTAEEVAKSPDALANDPRFHYVNVSLLGDAPMDLTQFHSLGELYVRALADSQPQFKRVFETLAAESEGAVLYHCTAGKDRTGLVTAILLELAGVDRAAIVHNYAISAAYLHSQTNTFVRSNPKLAYLAGTPPEAMGEFLDALDGRYGGARAYLAKIGVGDAAIDALSRRLGQN